MKEPAGGVGRRILGTAEFARVFVQSLTMTTTSTYNRLHPGSEPAAQARVCGADPLLALRASIHVRLSHCLHRGVCGASVAVPTTRSPTTTTSRRSFASGAARATVRTTKKADLDVTNYLNLMQGGASGAVDRAGRRGRQLSVYARHAQGRAIHAAERGQASRRRDRFAATWINGGALENAGSKAAKPKAENGRWRPESHPA